MMALTRTLVTTARGNRPQRSTPRLIQRAGKQLAKPTTGTIDFPTRLVRREMAAFEEAVAVFTPKLLGVAKKFLRNAEDAADAVQDTFMLAYIAIDTFQGRSSFYTWLYRILVNNCLMKLRSQSNARSVSLDHISRTASLNPVAAPVDRHSDSQVSRLERFETTQFVRDCIGKLPVAYRSIILLRDIERLDTIQAAGILNISPGAVKTRLHRARQALRRMIERSRKNVFEDHDDPRNQPSPIASNKA